MHRDSRIGGKLMTTTRVAVVLAGAVVMAGVADAAGDGDPPAGGRTVTFESRILPANPAPGDPIRAAIDQALGGLPPAPKPERPALRIAATRRAVPESSLIQMLAAELRLITATARPTPEQRRQIALAGGRALRQAREGDERGRFLVASDRGRTDSSGPHRMIRDALAAAAFDRLGAEPTSRYLAEWDARDQARKQVATVEIVARLDEALTLNADQRERIAAMLRTQWDSPIFPTPAGLAAQEGVLPAFLPHLVGGALTDDQSKLLASLPLFNFGRTEASPYNTAEGVRFSIEDEADDPDLKAALAEAGRP